MIVNDNKLDPQLCWIDCEMTGLEEDDILLEIGLKISDFEANNIITGPSLVLHASHERLLRMNNWCMETHRANGLWDEAVNSSLTINEAEEIITKWLHNQNINTLHMAGNTVWQDRFFLNKYMPKIMSLFHYRILDVSSFKIFFSNVNHMDFDKSQYQEKHRVMPDIDLSIIEYKYYLNIMKFNKNKIYDEDILEGI